MNWVCPSLLLAATISCVLTAPPLSQLPSEKGTKEKRSHVPQNIHHANTVLTQDAGVKTQLTNGGISEYLRQKALFINTDYSGYIRETARATNGDESKEQKNKDQKVDFSRIGWPTITTQSGLSTASINATSHAYLPNQPDGHQKFQYVWEDSPVPDQRHKSLSTINLPNSNMEPVYGVNQHDHNKNYLFSTNIAPHDINNVEESSNHTGYGYASVGSKNEVEQPKVLYDTTSLSETELLYFKEFLAHNGITLDGENTFSNGGFLSGKNLDELLRRPTKGHTQEVGAEQANVYTDKGYSKDFGFRQPRVKEIKNDPEAGIRFDSTNKVSGGYLVHSTPSQHENAITNEPEAYAHGVGRGSGWVGLAEGSLDGGYLPNTDGDSTNSEGPYRPFGKIAVKETVPDESANVIFAGEENSSSVAGSASLTDSSQPLHSVEPPPEKSTSSANENSEMPSHRGAADTNISEDGLSKGKHHEPAKYSYRYEVNNEKTGDIKSHEEERDGDFTKGTYSLHDPDGNIRTVNYQVKGSSGFKAMVIRTKITKEQNESPASKSETNLPITRR